MKWRVASAYNLISATIGSIVLTCAAIMVEQKTLGVTRQPLPLVWPLAVLHVTIAQLPLRNILGPLERAIVRGIASRGSRAAFALLTIMSACLTYATVDRRPELAAFLLLLSGCGFLVSTFKGQEAWQWTLALGMLVICLIFMTPLATPIGATLVKISAAGAIAFTTLAGVMYVCGIPTRIAGFNARVRCRLAKEQLVS